MRKLWMAGVAALSMGCFLPTLAAQAVAPVKHEGCVMASPTEADTLLLAEGGSCSVLRGKAAKMSLTGHLVVFEGLDSAASATEPLSVTVEKIESVGGACSQICTLEPPGHRGLHKKERPGSQGGTPGE